MNVTAEISNTVHNTIVLGYMTLFLAEYFLVWLNAFLANLYNYLPNNFLLQ